MGKTSRDRLRPWEAAALLTVYLYWWGVVYPPLCPPERTTAQETAALTEDDAGLIAGDGPGYVLRFRVLEWWDEFAARWE